MGGVMFKMNCKIIKVSIDKDKTQIVINALPIEDKIDFLKFLINEDCILSLEKAQIKIPFVKPLEK